MKSRLFLAPVAALLCTFAPVSSAQGCFFGDDGFDTGCCAAPLTNLPVFPPTTMVGNYGRMVGCALSGTTPIQLQLGAPAFVLCDFAVISVNATLLPSSATTGGQVINGTLFAKYSRTWLDVGNTGLVGQVWRFLINGDLQCTAPASMTPCTSLLPTCAFVTPPVPVHFEGFLDYACDPTTAAGTYNVVFNLNHMQGCITHAPWSCASLSGNPAHAASSYHLVAPAPFTFSNGSAPQGSLLSDAVRPSFLRLIPGFAYSCISESHVNPFGASLTTASNAGCSCGGSFNPCTGTSSTCAGQTCYENQSLLGSTCCPPPVVNPFNSVPIAGTPVAPTGLLAHSFGGWALPNRYPWSGRLTTYFGVVNYTDPCGQANWNLHVVVGAGISSITGRPFQSTPGCGGPTGLLSTAFIDLQNQLPLTSANLFPGYGCLSACDMVWNLNL